MPWERRSRLLPRPVDSRLLRATLRSVTREAFLELLRAAPGIEVSGGRLDVAEGHRMTVHLGDPLRGLQFPEVCRGELREDFAVLESREGEHLLVRYEALAAVAVRPRRDGDERRPGF